jgi:hypothetical protein
MLARLKYIDFRRDEDYLDRFMDLINILRGRPISRGGITDIYDVHFREDAVLFVQHRRIFNREAFRLPCLAELSLPELKHAIHSVAAALNTGTLISRGVPLPLYLIRVPIDCRSSGVPSPGYRIILRSLNERLPNAINFSNGTRDRVFQMSSSPN